MAAYISFEPSDYFSTVLYTGNASTNIISGIGFDPAFTWIKERDGTNNQEVFDTVRGDDKHWETNNNNPEATESGAFAFGSDQFTLGNWTPINGSGNLTVAWNWKMGTTTGIAGSPSITPTGYSFNATSGQSIIAYTGNATSGATIPHGLGAAPGFIIVKNYTAASRDTYIYHQSLGATKRIYFNQSDAATTSAAGWNDTAPTSTLVTLGNNEAVNENTESIIAYCFAEKTGFSKFGDYTGTGDASISPFIYTGFRPSMVIIKNAGAAEAWRQWDDKREGYNSTNDSLSPNNNWAEATGGTAQGIDILSNGFKITSSNSEVNTSGTEYIYCAWAAFPIVSSNDTPGVAR